MAFRSVVVANPARLRSRGEQLIIEREDVVSVPQEDISALIIQSSEVVISSAALANLANAAVPTIICDRSHMPAGVMLPISPHSRQLSMVKLQLNATVPLQKRIWQLIVKRKIRNQAATLAWSGHNDVSTLIEYANSTLSGDSTNREAAAARWYFARLDGGFRRRDELLLNAALDFGYSIVRSCIARSVVSHGFVPALGIHHCNEYNQFNLADDLLEPFRPIVDAFILQLITPSHEFLDEIKSAIPGVIHQRCAVDGRIVSVDTAVATTAASLVTALREKDYRRIKLPGALTPGVVGTTREGENAPHETHGDVRSAHQDQGRKARLYAVS